MDSLKTRVKKAFHRDRSIATRSPLTASATDSVETSSRNPSDPPVPPSNRPIHDPQVVRTVPSPTRPTTDPVPEAEPGLEECKSMTEPLEPQNPELPISQRLWNAAYENLGKNDDTSKLVKSYVKILTTVLTAEGASDASTSKTNAISAELEDPVRRQEYMRDLVEKGQKNIATTSKIAEGLDNVIEYIDKAKDMISVAIENIPQAALPWAGVCLGLQILSNPGKATKSNLGGIAHIISRMDWYCALTEHLLDNNKIIIGGKSFEQVLTTLEETIITLYEALLQYQIKSVCYYRSRSLAILRGLTNWDDWDGDLKSVTDAEAKVESMSVQYHREYEKSSLRQLVDSGKKMDAMLDGIQKDLRDFMAQQKNARIDDQDAECLQALFVMDPQDDMDLIQKEQKEELFSDAQKLILDTNEYVMFTNWSTDEPLKHSSRLLWIKGPAGTGKTMLLIGIIRQLSGQYAVLSPNISHFFCQSTTDKAHKNATDVLKCLIWMLLIQQPHLISHLRTEHRHKGRPLFSDERAFIAVSRAFKCMLKDPRLSATYFIIDALDECDQGLAELLELISTSLELTDKVKWLVSSRPEVNVLARLKDLDAKNLDSIGNLMELDAQSLEGPVNIYIDYKLSTLKTKVGYDNTILAEVSNLVRQHAGNTFLWVALVFKELDSVEGWDAVEIVKKIPAGLTELYTHMMTRIEHSNDKNWQRCKDVLVATFLACRLLSLMELTVLAGLSPQMTQTVIGKCGSFLTIIGETVSLIHNSAKEYLDTIYTSKLQEGGAVQGHAEISRRSIDAISKLPKNIYSLHPGSELGDITIPSPDPLEGLQYCCVYWIQHLQESNTKLCDNDQVHQFLQVHLLHWLEALGWMGKISEGIRAIASLESIVLTGKCPHLYAFIHDVTRFVLYSRLVIEQAPLQIYCGALIFAPANSIVTQQFMDEVPGWIQRLPDVQKDWGALIQTLEGQNSAVKVVVFSPDGKQLASSSWDNTIRLWDTTAGTSLGRLEPSKTVKDEIKAIAFSTDSKILVFATDDAKVYSWDMTKGVKLKTVRGFTGFDNIVAFSSGANWLVSASKNDTVVRLWDRTTATILRIFNGHEAPLSALAFSVNSVQLASASKDGAIKIWDTTNNAASQTLNGHEGGIDALAFSPDGRQLASGGWDRTIRHWAVSTGKLLHTFDGPRVWEGISVAFSPEGGQFASASSHYTIIVQDAVLKDRLQTLRGHDGSINSLVFSPKGLLLASGSSDNTVKLWGVSQKADLQTFDGHVDKVRVVVFSPDGKQLVSASLDSEVRLWDTATGTCLRTFRGHRNTVYTMAFSTDSVKLATASDDGTMKIWDTVSGKQLDEVKIPGPVYVIRFSHDGQQVALGGMNDDLVMLWRISSRELLRKLEGHKEGVHAVAFSLDGAMLASASEDGTIKIWDAATGMALKTLQVHTKRHSHRIYAVAFSADSRLLASTSSDRTIKLWDLATASLKASIVTACGADDIWFSKDSSCFETESEIVKINSDSLSLVASKVPRIFVRDCWVVWGMTRLILLPPEYRVTCQASFGNLLALGHLSGRVSFLELDMADLPLNTA